MTAFVRDENDGVRRGRGKGGLRRPKGTCLELRRRRSLTPCEAAGGGRTR